MSIGARAPLTMAAAGSTVHITLTILWDPRWSRTALGATGPVNDQDKTLAICNETDSERYLRRVPKKNFHQEKGHEYRSPYATARITLLDEVLEDIRRATLPTRTTPWGRSPGSRAPPSTIHMLAQQPGPNKRGEPVGE